MVENHYGLIKTWVKDSAIELKGEMEELVRISHTNIIENQTNMQNEELSNTSHCIDDNRSECEESINFPQKLKQCPEQISESEFGISYESNFSSDDGYL